MSGGGRLHEPSKPAEVARRQVQARDARLFVVQFLTPSRSTGWAGRLGDRAGEGVGAVIVGYVPIQGNGRLSDWNQRLIQLKLTPELTPGGRILHPKS